MRILSFTRQLILIITVAFSAPTLAEAPDRDLLGDPNHKIVYQLNKADAQYIGSILFSAGAMLRQYDDDIHIVITLIGPGIHLAAKFPERPIPLELKQRAASLAQYGVEFHVCGNTLKSLNWADENIEDYATIVEVGANDLMLLQEEGYSYISW